jgi:hypothetical protein
MLPFGLDFECARSSASPRDDDDVFANSAAAATGSARSFQTFRFPSTDCFRLSVQNLVPVTALNGRPKPRERDAEFSRKRLVPVGKAIAWSISVGGATEKRVRKHCNIDEQRLDRGDRARPHAAASRGVERVSTKILNRRETQGVDRRLCENQPWKRRTLQRQSKERLYAPSQRTFVSRASDIHVRDGAGVIEMGEPDTANGTLSQNAGRGRRLNNRSR